MRFQRDDADVWRRLALHDMRADIQLRSPAALSRLRREAATTNMSITLTDRDIARAALQRFSMEELSPAELAIEIERWEQHRALLAGDLAAEDDTENDAATLQAGIAYADHRLAELERQAGRVLRAGLTDDTPPQIDFDTARYADLVGLAETLTGSTARKTGRDRYRIPCPFHDDRHPSLVIYPPGQGWWCPVCHKGGQDAASFTAEYFNCSQLEGLRIVQQMTDGVRV